MSEAGKWFVIQSGTNEGRWHLSGWHLSAVAAAPGERSQYRAVAFCPRCGAMVDNDDTPSAANIGAMVWLHEDWHAATDYPRPTDA
jgi:hypothetical protein